MTCHYLEEQDRQKICRAKGILPPTIHELRIYCYKLAYDCPHYKKYLEKMTKITSNDEEKQKQDHLDQEYTEHFDKGLY
jgi:hypothetical protein